MVSRERRPGKRCQAVKAATKAGPKAEPAVDNGRLLTVQEVADRLRISADFVYAECRSGRLPRYKFGASVRIALADLEAYELACRTTEAAARPTLALRHVRLPS